MKNRTIYLFLLIAGLASCSKTKKEPFPNIIFILADDMGYGDVSALNPEGKISTPNIDRIAENGVIFRDAHSSSAVCTPTRYGILTGRYNWRSTLKKGVLNGYSKPLIPEGRTTVASMLKQQGYHTACIGKWHLGWDWHNAEKGNDSVDFSQPIKHGPTSLGFDYFYGFSGSLDMPPYVYVENDRPTALPDRLTVGNNTPLGESGSDGSFWREGPTGSDFDLWDCLPNLTRKAVKYIDERAEAEQPFFLYFPMPAPHTPILPTEAFKGKSGINTYADFVMMVDHMVGKVTRALEENGVLENTLLVFTSDNGCSPWADFKTLADAGHNPGYIFRGNKADLFEGGHHIPCVAQWPAGIKVPHEVAQTVCLNDFMATFAALTGYMLTDNEAEDSFNLLPALINENHNQPVREALVHHSINGSFAIRKGDWKLLLAAGSGGWSSPRPGAEEEGLPPVQLYNLKDDPAETNNLQEKYPEVVNELAVLLKKLITEGRSTPGALQENDGDMQWEQQKWTDFAKQ